ncbi:MAG: hypothetical protein JJU05_16115 [Verrucomicrobia bacterium]|nr:hypothetical protein [Verrucomicrobiota bacterium]
MNIFEILHMWLLKVSPSKIYKTQTRLEEEGLSVATKDLIAHYLASNEEMNELIELVSAIKRHDLEIDMPLASALVLSDRSDQVVKNLDNPEYRQKYIEMWKSKILT